MFSTGAHWGSWLGYPGWAGDHRHLYCLDVDYQLCSRCFVNADFAGWGMSDEWKTEYYQKLFCTESSLLLIAILGVPNHAIRIFESGTWQSWILTWINGNNWQWTSPSGVVTYKLTKNIITALKNKRRLLKKTVNFVVANNVINY